MDRDTNNNNNNNAAPSRLLTYRYSRRQLAHHNIGLDSYNAMATSFCNTTTTQSSSSQQQQQQQKPPLEYWTNGKTTHLMLVQEQQQDVPSLALISKKSHDSSSATTTTFPQPSHRNETSWNTTSTTTSSSTSLTTLDENRAYLKASSSSSPPPPSSSSSATTTSTPTTTNQIFRRSLLAGSVSGMASTIILYPLDVLRTKLQAPHGSTSSSSVGGGPLAVLRQTVQFGGLRALYTGVALPLAAQVLYKATIFSVHAVSVEWVRQFKSLERQKLGQDRQHCRQHHQQQQQQTLDYVDTAICGFVAGAVNAGAFVTPVELVRNQLIAQDSKLAAGQTISRYAANSWDVVRYTVQSHGISRLWRGAGITMLRDGVGVAAFFATKRAVEESLGTRDTNSSSSGRSRRQPTFVTSVLSGGLAGLAFWVTSLPLDTMKTWIQSGDLHKPPVHVAKELRRIFYQEGGTQALFRRLLRGWQVAYGRGIPSAAITISVYSTVYNALEQRG